MDVLIIGAGLAGLGCARISASLAAIDAATGDQSLSSIHWAMVSGRRAAEAVIRELQQ